MTRPARWPASPPATWASARTASPRMHSPAAWSCAPNTRSSPKARAALSASSCSPGSSSARAASRRNSASASRSCGRSQPDKHKKGLVQHSFGWPLDGANRRRLVPLSLRRQSGVGRLRRAPQLHQPVSVAVRGVPALQDASAGARHLRRRQAPRLRRARAHRRRLPVGAEADLPGRRADRLRRRLHERAAHQGQPQRHALRHDGGGGGRRSACRRPRARRACRL